MVVSPIALDEVVDFITSGPQPSDIIAFRPSEAAQNRLNDLLAKKSAHQLSEEEQTEVDYFLFLEHLMRMSKIRATEKLAA